MKITATELTTEAYHRLREMIHDGSLQPGQKIVQEKIAEQLGISRTPLRSALQLLEGENLVVAVPRRGMFVRQYSPREINHIFDCRVALESTAARLCAQRATPELVGELAEIFDPFRNTTNIEDKAYQRADARFHQLLMDACGNPFLQRMYRQGNVGICLDMIGLLRPARETLREHLDIIRCLRQGDDVGAESHMKLHLTATQKLLTDG